MHVLLSPHAAAGHGRHLQQASAAHSALTGPVHRHAGGTSLAERVTPGLEIALLFTMADAPHVGRSR
ncbi:hypothetical protein [Streptomyces sp. NPDC058614]|uniref:hypothetical protein n=1 Tax=Streptomyces sp. NPDC058614 TaxID=3346557 RepID=UPI00366632EE